MSAVSTELVAMTKNPEDFEYALRMKREALGPHIAERWGWDDALQRTQQAGSWQALSFFRIMRDGAAIGAVSLEEADSHLTLIGLYILPAFQGKGSGTQVLRQVVFDAAARGLPVRLRCLKWNPALSLYRRHGFLVIGETETHFQMERPLS